VIGTPTTTPPAGTSWGYYNGVYSWAGDFSYSATPNYADTAGGPLSGPADIAVTLTGPFGAWQPYMASSFSWPSTGYTKLTFALKPTVPGQQWSSQFVGVGDVALPSNCSVNVLNYGPAPVAGQWATYTIPLADMCVLNQSLYKFAIQDQTGLSSNVWYVDNVGFVP